MGFEPTRRERPDGFQDRSLQPDLGNLPKIPPTGLEPVTSLRICLFNSIVTNVIVFITGD